MDLLRSSAGGVPDRESCDSAPARLDVPQCLHGRKIAGAYWLFIRGPSLQEQRVQLAVLGNSHLLLSTVRSNQGSSDGADFVSRRSRRVDQESTAPGLRVRAVHVSILDRALLVDGREVVAVHVVADAIYLHVCGGRRGPNR